MPADDEALAAPEPAASAALAAVDAEPYEGEHEPSPEALIPKGNRLRPRWFYVAAASLLPLFLLMASDRHFALSVPLGAGTLLFAAYALLSALGTLDDPGSEESGAEHVSLRALAPRLVETGGALVAVVFALRLAVGGALPSPVLAAALLVTGSLVWLLIALCRLSEASHIFELGSARWFARRGFWLVLSNILLYVPRLGSYSLSDPWEAHYAEVAREMLARDDWISLWWAQDGWFWSKPVLDFWLQALGFSLTGVHYMPDQVLASAGLGLSPAPEWPARVPIFLLTVLATYLLYKAVEKAFGGRAGFLAGLVLTTAPYWYLIAHQSMTDMPYVAPLTAALALVVLGLRTEPERRVRSVALRVRTRVLRLSGFHLLFGAILLSVLPQVVYLLTRNVTLQLSLPHFGFRWHLDEFFSGSGGGNCGLPGNEPCQWAEPANRIFEPALAALVWGGALGLLLFVNRGERRLQRLYFLGAWYFTALSTLSKGAPGLVLPITIALVGVGAARRYKDFARLELVGLALVVACVCLPWYVQMYMRHGPPFTDRLLFHDMYKRAFVHVHDTNTGDDVSFRYYVWQLGYGLFPWAGFGAAGLLWWLRYQPALLSQDSGGQAEAAQAEVMAFMALWFALAFGMFTITLTKFHHYALPTVPPIAAVTGVLLDRAFGTAPLTRERRDLPRYLFGLATSALLLVYGASRFFTGAFNGQLMGGRPLSAAPFLAVTCLACGCGLAWLTVRRVGHVARASSDAGYESAALGFLGIASAVPVVLVGRDLFSTVAGDIDGPARLMHLFTYNYRRAWPADSRDFSGILTAFTLVCAALSIGLAWPSFRRHALALFALVAVVWTAWGIDVYLIAAAPHWGQRETIFAYYAARKGPGEPFVAYQMNWKGENFYTGNRLPAFVSTGAKFKSWIAEQKANGVSVMFFTTEHSRISSLKNELGTVKAFTLLTGRELNNKFTLARVEL